MATAKRQVLMRFQPESYDKLKILAAYNRRSVTNQVEILVDQFIKNYENQHGTIPLMNDNKPDNSNSINVNNFNLNDHAENCVANVNV